ncbi:aldehyde dehydrogenase [Cohnella sp. 56]|uniref:aldehyde dehydrogenase n=1 Tax=Cohnella sp. 56 TaxID=3113722 RepID=UPI0040400BE9
MTEAANVELALRAHRDYFAAGHTLPLAYRIEQLKKLGRAIRLHEEALMQALAADLGKSRFESYATEIGLVLGSLRYAAKHLRRWARPKRVRSTLAMLPATSFIRKEPYGTVLIVGPFNYPVQLLFEPLIGAIAAGNCAVLKPSEATPHVAAAIARLIGDTFEPAYVRVLEGGKALTSALVHAPFDYIFFTGSTSVGKIVMEAAARNLVPVTLELGGKSPAIVDETANLPLAAKKIAWGKLMNAGQTCIAPDYVLVHRSMKDKFISLLIGTIRAFYGEDAAASADYGRIVNERQFDRLAQVLAQDRQHVVYGGRTDRADRYIEPTLLDLGAAADTAANAAAMQDELFGPLLPVVVYDDLAEAVSFVRDRPKPLALYLFTSSKSAERAVLERIPFGGGCVNDTILHISNPRLPFGGIGPSGLGAYHGRHSFELFSHAKSVVRRGARSLDPGLAYPPYGDRLKWVRRLLR